MGRTTITDRKREAAEVRAKRTKIIAELTEELTEAKDIMRVVTDMTERQIVGAKINELQAQIDDERAAIAEAEQAVTNTDFSTIARQMVGGKQ